MESQSTILYELVCCAEWIQEKEEAIQFPSISTCTSGVFSYVNPTAFFRNKPLSPSETAVWINSLGPPWQYAVTSDGKIIAVLQDTILETRSSKDNFVSVLGKSHVPKDEFPNFRKMAWSKDSSLLAVSFTNGLIVVFDIMASQMCSVRRFETVIPSEGPKIPFSIDYSLAGMFFVDERLKKTPYCSEVISVDRRGCVKSFRQTSTDEMEFHHEASFKQYYPSEVTDVQYSESHKIILVAGNLIQDSNSQVPNWRHGITAWRLLLDSPYYRILFAVDGENFKMDAKRLWKIAFMLTSSTSLEHESILKMSFSPNGNQMAAIHVSGAISIWQLPSLKLIFIWPLKSLFQYNVSNPRFNCKWRNFFNQSQTRPMDPLIFHPYDVNWWSDESIIVSRVNGCLTLIPVCDCPSKNLLGDSPELFESAVRTSPRYEKNFFALESEIRYKGDSSENYTVVEANLPGSWVKNLTQEALFWVTDMERFRPPRKNKKKLPTWIQSYRIFTVRNITPQELFYRKIEQEEYGEAIDLAKIYKLDADLVYQRQWTKTPVSVHSIKDFLAKITKRNWVLRECLDRVPDTIDAARELLQFGLKGTDLTVAVLISQGKDKGKFILWAPDDLDIAKEEYLSLVDVNNAEVIRLLRYRKRFLHFIDMLNTYELIVGGPRVVEENYNSKSYGALRSRNTVESAIEMARSCDTNGLKILLTNHWNDISLHYMDIISSFPETWSPHDYKDFLPEINENENVVLWPDVESKDMDWCEAFLLKADTSFNQTYAENSEVTREEVYVWYYRRIQEIESLSGIINYALDLGLLGLERNVLELQSLVHDLQTLETLVYEVQIENMTLGKLKVLSYLERIQLLLSKSTDESFVSDFRYYVLPFVSNCEDNEEGSSYTLLNEYMTSLCSSDLSLVLKIFEASKRSDFDPLIPDLKDLMLLAHNCIYKCENFEQTENVMAILGCLPERGFEKKSPSMENLHHLIDNLEVHFSTVQLLQKYFVHLTVESIKQVSRNEDKASIEDFLVNICRSASRMHPPLKINDWKILLYDILELRKKLFNKFEMERSFEIYVTGLLKSGSSEIIKLAKNFLEKSPSANDSNLSQKSRNISEYSASFSLYLHIIPYEQGLDMIIDSAQMYFDSSSNYSDPDMELCKICLNLVENPKEPRVAFMFDLMDAVKLMNKDFRLNILPHAVRICEDKMNLIHQAIQKSKGGYKKIQQLLKLVLFLHIEGMSMEEAESIVLEMAGNTAMLNGDMKLGIQICHTIMAREYPTGWAIFTNLAKFQSDTPIMDADTNSSFINYALLICPDSEILTVLNVKYLIEIDSLESRLQDLTPSDSSALDAIKLRIKRLRTLYTTN